MKPLLLDTHALLWCVGQPENLSTRAREAVEAPENRLLVSPVSLFEISTKVRIGKLRHPGPLLGNWQWALARLGADLLTLSGGSAIRAGALDTPHRDPFDRLLAAQALEDSCTLVSSDHAFRTIQGLDLLW